MNKDEFDRTPRRRSRVGLFLAVLVIACGLAWLIHSRTHQQQDGASGHGHGGGAPGSGPMPVATVKAVVGAVPIIVDALGTVTPLSDVTVRTQIAGQLTQVAFKEGQTVKAGDFLAQIDPRPYQLQLEQALGALHRDEALLADAKKDLLRYETLLKQDSIARQQVDTQTATVKQDIGAVATDQAQVDTAKLNLIYCHIVAPSGGRIGLRQVDAGNYVQTSDANGIVVITQMDPISVIFTVPEDNLPVIMKRLAGGAILPVTALDRSETTTLATGVLTTVDNVIDTATGTVKMRAQFDNKDGALFANQFVNVHLLVDTESNVIVLPTSAIQRGEPGTFVYTIDPSDSTAHVVKVTLGATAGDNIAVTSGLTAGQLVVSDGADKLKDGGKVMLPGAKPTEESANGQESGKSGHKHGRHAQSSGDSSGQGE
jgi:multidrug efflux system membrane fusion protein